MADVTGMLMASAGNGGGVDPDFENVALLLHGDGTNGAQNNTFQDSSANNFTVTRNGDATQGSFSPFSRPDGRWGTYFDGVFDSADSHYSLSAAFTTAFGGLGGNNFTIEMWVLCNNPANTQSAGLIGAYEATAANGRWTFTVYNNKLRFGWTTSTGSEEGIDSTTSLTVGAWNHVAVTIAATSSTNTTVRLFVNGVMTTHTGKNFSTQTSTFSPITIGGNMSQYVDGLDGYISNLRVVKGALLYTANFTPPTAPLPNASSGTTLLRTCQSNRVIDNSPTPYVMTPAGVLPPVIVPLSPFPLQSDYTTYVNGGSAYFDGNGDDLRTGTANLGSNSFTIEFWIYPFDVSTTQLVLYSLINGAKTDVFALQLSTGSMLTYAAAGTPWTMINGLSMGSVQPNAWNHVAITRSGSTFYGYTNGVRGFTATSVVAIGSLNGFALGSAGNGTFFFNGFMAGFRQLTGVASYTGTTYTVPSVPPVRTTSTSLLLNFTNGAIFDNSGCNNLVTVGNTQIDTAIKKYGTGSIQFDGTGDSLLIPYSPELNLATTASGAKYTIECWVYKNASTTMGIISRQNGSNGYTLRINSNGTAQFFYVASSSVTSSTTISNSTWTHIAVVRNVNSVVIYLNGVNRGSATFGVEIDPIAPLRIGAERDNTGIFNGYIDEFRVTNGVARYTGNFTPPGIFPNRGP